MYRTPVRERGLEAVDDALLRLRRLWSASRSHLVDDAGARVELSSLLVVEACARRAARGAETSVGDVARLADVEPSTASRLVDRAQQAGLVARRPSAASARRTALELTEAGAALRERAVRARLRWLAGRLDGWSEADVAAFGALLTRFADGLGDPAPPATGSPGPPRPGR